MKCVSVTVCQCDLHIISTPNISPFLSPAQPGPTAAQGQPAGPEATAGGAGAATDVAPEVRSEDISRKIYISVHVGIFQQKIQRRLPAVRQKDKQEAETELAFQDWRSWARR